MQESVAPEGYVLDNTKHVVHINHYDPATESDPVLVLTNDSTPRLVIEKPDSSTLENVVFRIDKVDGTFTKEYTSDRYGEITLEDLEPGAYTVTEITAPTGYLLNSELHHVTLKAGRENEIVIQNERKPNLTIKKYDSLNCKPMADTKFEVHLDIVRIFNGGLHPENGLIYSCNYSLSENSDGMRKFFTLPKKRTLS